MDPAERQSCEQLLQQPYFDSFRAAAELGKEHEKSSRKAARLTRKHVPGVGFPCCLIFQSGGAVLLLASRVGCAGRRGCWAALGCILRRKQALAKE